MIEDCFDATARTIKIDGKTFNPSNKSSTASHYGKADFAYQVVQRYAGFVDFGGFQGLLHNMTLAIEDYSTRAKP